MIALSSSVLSGVRAAVGQPATRQRPVRTIDVGVGELAVTSDRDLVLATHALGTCVAVCIWDPQASVAGLLHFLLPDSLLHPARAQSQPAAFADCGIPLLFEEAYQRGLHKARAVVRLVGGGESTVASFQIGRRNLAAARKLFWSNGVLIDRAVTGGALPRSVYLSAGTGRLHIKTGSTTVVIE